MNNFKYLQQQITSVYSTWLASSFIDWFEKSNLILNISKTKEMQIDFRKAQSPKPTLIYGDPIDGHRVQVPWHCARPQQLQYLRAFNEIDNKP